jgi:hypothetical protein
MAGENTASVKVNDKAGEGDEGRQRSTISFPYEDLSSAFEIAQAIHTNVGMGDCEDEQIAAWTKQSHKSSGFRLQMAAARLFGLIESTAGRHRLGELGRMIVDPQRTREARVRAFLNCPLYSAVFEKYKGGVLPPTAAFERDIQLLGVSEKMKDRARRGLEKSAEFAGFFEQGKDRLVRPGIAIREEGESARKADSDEVAHDENLNRNGGGGGGGRRLHPFIQGLLDTIPEIPNPTEKPEWPVVDRVKWLQTAANIFDLIYKGDGGISVSHARADRSPRHDDH